MNDLRVYFGSKHMFDYTMKKLEKETDFRWIIGEEKPTEVKFLESNFPLVLILHKNKLSWSMHTTEFDFDVWKFLDFYFLTSPAV